MLPDWVSTCEVDGQIVFLDIRANRYARIRKELADAVIQGKRDDLRPDFRSKVTSIGWPNVKPAAVRSSSVPIIRPYREHSAEYEEGRALKRQMVSAFGSLLAAKMILACASLDAVLAKVQANNLRASAVGTGAIQRTDWIAAFDNVERAVIGNDRCLHRSIALQFLLARNGFPSTLVFGVRLNPFHAHCWLQDGDLVLNDTLEVVGPFTAIRAVG